MEDLYNKASLVLTPQMVEAGKVYSMKPEDRKGDFTFSRSTYATRVNASGNIEKETQNLLVQSNTFDTTWSLTNATLTSGQAGYDGSNNAWLLNATNWFSSVRQSISQSGVQTLSVYAKAGSYNFVRLGCYDGSSIYDSYFDLQNGTLGTGLNEIDANIESIGSGWYRCSVSVNTNTTEVRIYSAVADNDGTGTSGNIYIQDAQLEQGLVARDVITTTTSAIYGGITDNVPRLDYQGSCPALLLEPQRTNIVPISEGVPEGTNSVTLTENYATSPEGAQNSLKVQKNGVDSNDRIQPIGNYNATLISGNDYTISCFVKNIDSTNAVTTLACRVSGGSLFRSGYDWEGSSLSYLATGYNAGTRKNIFVEDYGNGWWRIGFTFEANGTSGNFELDIDRRNGSNTTSIETWGWQLEAGSYATSYIPTYGSAVTRNVDVCSVTGISDILNDNEGTLFVEMSALANDQTSRRLSISDGTNNNRVMIGYSTGSNAVQFVLSDSGAVVVNSGYTLSDITETAKIAFKYKVNDCEIYVNGSRVILDPTATMPSGLDVLGFYQGSTNENLFANVKQVTYFPTALTDQEAIDLTTI